MISIEELLIEKKIHFKSVGSGNFVISCLSPIHEDKNPSMKINGATGMGICFSCGYSCSLYTHFGIIDNLVSAKAHKILLNIDKLRNREITIPKGYVPFPSTFRGISKDTLSKFKAFSHPVLFIDSICFPLYNMAGKLKAIIARDKESNQTRYKIFPAGASLPYFPSKPEPANGTVIIVEGIFDALVPYDKGLKCCVATMGVNQGKDQLTNLVTGLKLVGTTRIVIAYDNDKAGIDASTKLQNRLEKHFPIVEVFDWLDSTGEAIDLKDFGESSKATLSIISEKIFGFDIT